jgi:hypothetical protein
MSDENPEAGEGKEGKEPETEQDEEDAPPEVTRAQVFLRMLAVTVVLFGILEIVARTVLHFRTKSAETAAAADYPPSTYVPDFTARVDYRFINFYTADPARANNEAYDFDTFGFRLDSQKLRFDAPSTFKKIWMLGGSTVQGLGVRGDETVPAHLNKLLEADHSQYRVINMGQAGFTSTQELLLLIETLQSGFKPDAIVSYDGASEIPFAGEIAKTGWPAWEKRSSKSSILQDVQGGETVGTLLPLTLLRLTKMDDLMMSLGKPPPNAAYPAGNWDVVARRYLTTLNMIKTLADGQKAPSFFFFQPVLQYEDHYKLRKIAADEERFRARVAPDEHMRCEAVAAEAVAELRTRLGTFFDIHEVFKGHDGEKLYADPRHPVGAGNAIIAARIYEEIKKLDAAAK